MKVLPFKVPKPNADAIVYQEDKEVVFYNQLHQHEEIQISFIAKGRGTLIVGNTVNDYNEGDILVIGGNLPHVFKSDASNKDTSFMISLFFTTTSFGSSFFRLEELKELKPFFNWAENGFKLSHTSNQLQSIFFSLKSNTKLERLIALLDLLKLLSKTEPTPLSSYVYEKSYSDIEGKRMRNVIEYTMNNFSSYISLEQIAAKAAMTKNAFCKYFKKRTNKTYFHFLNEIRVENAAKLLINNNDYSIAEIAELSGFNNISNFNRQFKFIKGFSPRVFKKKRALNY